MTIEIKVPSLGESVTEATLSRWLKQSGEAVVLDEPVAELETDKVTFEVSTPAAGTISEIAVEEGANVAVGAVLCRIAEAGEKVPSPRPPAAAAPEHPEPSTPERQVARARLLEQAGPAVRKLIEESGVDIAAIAPSGRNGRITKADVMAALARPEPAPAPEPRLAAPPTPAPSPPPSEIVAKLPAERETRVRMTRLRKRIAERLKAAQNTAAMLSTFNEIDMSAVIALREQHRAAFEQKHGVRLGFMSFFVKAALVALRELPAVNAEIDGDDIVYKNHYDIGVAVGSEQGLVVPVIRNADRMGFAEMETTIADLGRKAREGKLSIADLSGGTFTISNGGIYGSMLSTPILNPPQSAILGMHKIERRPVAVGEAGAERVEIRPMMYVALSYDHRVIDGREAVTFLVRIKECVEDPGRLLFEI